MKLLQRRTFLKAIFYVILVLLGTILFYPLMRYLLYKKFKKLMVTFHPNEQLRKVNFKEEVYLIKENQDFYALSAHCTHLGCIVNFNSITEKFHCDCHGSVFDISGKRITGPAKKPLSRLPLKFMKNGDIIVFMVKSS
jgi:cytochrome b6-f complex iron-sulfur subunit